MRPAGWFLGLGLAWVFLLTSGLVRANVDPPPEAREGEEQHHGLGKLETPAHPEENDPFGRALDLGLWSLVVFLLLVFILGKFAWKPMIEGLDQRERTIRDALAEAQKGREEANRLRDQFQQEMARAQEKVRDILDEARRNAQRQQDEMLEKTRAEIKTERDRLQREMELARDQALQDIWSQAARLATLISTKAIRRQLNADDHRQLVDEALAEIRQTAAG